MDDLSYKHRQFKIKIIQHYKNFIIITIQKKNLRINHHLEGLKIGRRPQDINT